MSRTQDLPLLVLSILFVFAFVSHPPLAQYSTQLFALSVLLFLMQRWKHNRTTLFSVLPTNSSLELIPLTIAVLVLISATGNTHSWVYALTYAYLFLLVFTLKTTASLVMTAAIFMLQLALIPAFTTQEIIILFNIPIITGVLLFAKKQLTTNQEELTLIKAEAAELTVSSNEVLTFERYLSEFLIPKSEALSKLGEPQTELEKTLLSQVDLLISESKKMLKEFEK